MDKMKICKKLYGYLPNSIMRFIEKKSRKQRYKNIITKHKARKISKKYRF